MRAEPIIPSTSPLRRLRSHRRFAGERLTILLPKDDYYVQAECARALRALGHRVVEVVLGQHGELGGHKPPLALLMQAVVAHRPDMLLTINYLGFDRASWFDEVIEATGLPCAVWLVDSPFVLAMGYLPPVPDLMTLFVWDRSYLPVLRAHGAADVLHLPLATCPSVFRPAPAAHRAALPSSFVGHSLAILCRTWRAACSEAEREQALLWQPRLEAKRSELHALVPTFGRPVDRQVVSLAYANYLASAQARATMLAALPQADLHVFGDDAWPRKLPRAHCYGPCTYGPQTAEIFRATAVNINITNAQMPTAVNQRVFDVPASGGFLLTDAQEELSSYFEVGTEAIAFANAAELRDKAAWYLRRPALRAKVVALAQLRIGREHHYTHRMRQVLGHMRHRHGRPRPGEAKGAASCASQLPMS